MFHSHIIKCVDIKKKSSNIIKKLLNPVNRITNVVSQQKNDAPLGKLKLYRNEKIPKSSTVSHIQWKYPIYNQWLFRRITPLYNGFNGNHPCHLNIQYPFFEIGGIEKKASFHTSKRQEKRENKNEENKEKEEKQETDSNKCQIKGIKGKKKFIKVNYLTNIESFLLRKKFRNVIDNITNKHSYKVFMKRMKLERNKINAMVLKYQMKKENLKINFSEHTYRKAVINTKKKIITFFNRNRNRSLMDIYNEEKRKYKLRKERLLEMQEKFIKNSKIAQSGIKRFFKKYGYVGMATYFGIFLITFISSYLCFHYKYISLSDLKYIAEKMHLNKYIDENLHKKVDSLGGELIFAYIVAKITEPLRIVVTILITPYIAKCLKLKKKSRLL